MRKAVTIQQIENEQTEDSDGGRIVPQLLSPKANNQPQLDSAVAEQIEGGELLAALGQTLRGMDQIIRNEITRVLRQFRPCKHAHQIEQKLRRNEVRTNAGGDFRQRKRAFEHKADLKGEVHLLLVKQSSCGNHFYLFHSNSCRRENS